MMPQDASVNAMAAPAASKSDAPCLRLRCKEMFIDYGTGEPFNLKDSASGIYWCSHTQDCLGPDGEVAHVSQCTAARPCYERA